MKVQVSWQETLRGANGLKKGSQGCACDRRKMLTHFEEGRVGREKFIRGKRKVEGFFVEGGVWMVEGEYSKVGKRIVKVRFWGG